LLGFLGKGRGKTGWWRVSNTVGGISQEGVWKGVLGVKVREGGRICVEKEARRGNVGGGGCASPPG